MHTVSACLVQTESEQQADDASCTLIQMESGMHSQIGSTLLSAKCSWISTTKAGTAMQILWQHQACSAAAAAAAADHHICAARA